MRAQFAICYESVKLFFILINNNEEKVKERGKERKRKYFH